MIEIQIHEMNCRGGYSVFDKGPRIWWHAEIFENQLSRNRFTALAEPVGHTFQEVPVGSLKLENSERTLDTYYIQP